MGGAEVLMFSGVVFMKELTILAELFMLGVYAILYLPILPLRLAHTYWHKFHSKDGMFAVIITDISYSLVGWTLLARLF